MSTPLPPERGPQNPSYGSASQPDLPGQAGPTATLPGPPRTSKPAGLAIAALVVGIVAFLVGLVPILGALVGIAAIVLGGLALRKRQSKAMAITGTVLGGIALLSSIIATAGLGAALDSVSDSLPAAVISESAAPTEIAEEPSAPPVETAAPVEPAAPAEPAEPVEEAAPAAPAAPQVSAEFASALIKAASYSDTLHMSKAGLFAQLTSEYGEQFSPEAAQYAVDNVQADWNANALAKAKDYQSQMAMSPEAIRDQLTSEYGEQFTAEEADFAILHLND